MIFRRVMLVVLPLLVAVFLFMFLRYLYLDYEAAQMAQERSPGEVSLQTPKGVEEMEVGKGYGHPISRNVRLVRKDEKGRVTTIFIADEIIHRAKNTADVARPCVHYFARPTKANQQGEIITIVADEATVMTSGSIMNVKDIESGVMRGHVVLSRDNGTPDDSSDDTLMGTSELAFDNKTYEITAPGPVVVVGLQMDLTARKMKMTLDRGTRKVTTLTFFEDIFLTLEPKERLRMGLVPEEAPGAKPPAAEPPATQTPSTTSAAQLAAGAPSGPPAAGAPAPKSLAAGPSAKPSGGKGAEPPPARKQGAKGGRAAPSPPSDLAAAEPQDAGKDLWQIDITGDVVARQEDQRLLGDHLMLYNETSSSGLKPGAAPEAAEPGRATPTAPGAPGAAAKASAGPTPSARGGARPPESAEQAGKRPAPATTGRPAPQKKDEVPEDVPRPRALSAADKAEFLKEGSPGPLVVTATGPLLMIALDPEQRKAVGEGRHEVVADGRPVIIEDGSTTVTGALVRYNRIKGTGVVDGKGGDIHLDQPDRVSLTGKRLEFDSPHATADVLGKGELHARVNTENLTGASAAPTEEAEAPAGAKPKAAPKEPSPLDATWEKGMSLVLYAQKTGRAAGAGGAAGRSGRATGNEIKQARFLGQAVVKQKDGLLKGEQLILDFDPSREGAGGQAINHLEGHGDVFVKREGPGGPPEPAGKAAAKDELGAFDITCQNLDMLFGREPSGATQPREMKASGQVAINDPTSKLRAEQLSVRFARTAKGGLDAQFLEAFGNVVIDRNDPRDELHAEGSHVRRDLKEGVLLLEGKPARAKRGQSEIAGPYVQFLQDEGLAVVRGAGELKTPAATDLRGQAREKPEPLHVTWKNGMRFEDQRNFAYFEGDAVATTGGSRLASQKLWVHFTDRPEKEGQPGGEKGDPKVAAAPARPGEKAPPAKDSGPSDGMDKLFGRKALVRLYAEKDVRTQDVQLDPDGAVRHQLELTGDNLTYVAEDRKAYIRGPGRFRLMGRERLRPGEAAAPGLAPKDVDSFWKGQAPPGYARTDVVWADSMAYEGGTGRAYFKGNVDARQVGRGVAGESGQRRAKPTDTRVKSADLQVVFAEKKTEGAAAKPAAPASASGPEEKMTVDKLLADGGVKLWMDDRRGSGQRFIYQREPELVRIFRGMDDLAHLWQENEAKQQYGEIEAGLITFIPSTGRVEVKDQKEITLSQ